MQTTYKYTFPLKNEVEATLIFDAESNEHTVNYSYEFSKLEGRKPVLTVKQRVHVSYIDGKLSPIINVTYEIINHVNAGKREFLGVDISDDHRVFLELSYKQDEGESEYRLDEVRKGINVVYSAQDKNAGDLMKPIDSPLNILTNIVNDYGEYQIPLCMGSDGESISIKSSQVQ
jgi:hypothetical protein